MGAHQSDVSAPATNRGGHVWNSKLHPTAIGINPATVVIAVSKTGLNRVRPASTIASCVFPDSCFFRLM